MLNKIALGATVSFSLIASGEDFPVTCKVSHPNRMDFFADPQTQIRVSGEWCDDTLLVTQKTYEEALQVCQESRAHMALRTYNLHIPLDSSELNNWDAKPVVTGAFWPGRYNVLPQEDKSEI